MSTVTGKLMEARHVEAGDVIQGTKDNPDVYGLGVKVLGVERFTGWVLIHTTAGAIDLNENTFVHVPGCCPSRIVTFEEIRPGDEIADLGDINGPFRCVMRTNSHTLIVHACPRGVCICDPARALSVTVVFKDNRPIRLRVR